MKRMIEALESRTLLSGTTSATLAGDNSLIISDAAAVKGAMNELFAVDLANDKTIATDLASGHAAGTSGIVASIKAAQTKAKAAFMKDINGLVNPGLALAKRSGTAGNSLLLRSTKPKIAMVAIDASALGKVAIKPLAKIQAQLANTKIFTDLEALRTLNSGNTTVSAAITVAEQGEDAQAANVTAAAMKFQTDLNTLSTHLVNIFSG